APATIPPTVDAAPASISASDATLNEAAESSTPAPSDMKAAMLRCRRGVISPRIALTSAPDAAANPQQKAHTPNNAFGHCHAPLGRDPRKPASGKQDGAEGNRSHSYNEANTRTVLRTGAVHCIAHLLTCDSPGRSA